MCFFACQSATFSCADGIIVPPQEISKTDETCSIYKQRQSHLALLTHTHTHNTRKTRRTVVVVDLFFFFCHRIHLKKNGEIIGNVPLGRANAVWIGLLGWGKFVLVHVVVFAFEREEYESGCW